MRPLLLAPALLLSLSSIGCRTDKPDGDGQVQDGGTDDGGTDDGDTGDTTGSDTGGGTDTGDDCIPEDEVCDGLDNDCDGVVDNGVTTDLWTDGDGDGFGAGEAFEGCEGDPDTAPIDGDCDDTDGSIYTGAPETWYDGVDSDCSGDDSDFDADGDGDDSDEHGGTDCDDTDGSIYAGAPDTWYDGVDSDCGGEESDFDADGDGDDSDEHGGTDCDDSDGSIYGGAPETWYDGVDSDCDDGSDYDADGDGDDSEDWGGGDCDDTDPDVYEGEGCRPPLDCDGVPDLTTIADNDPSGATDLVFDDDCRVYVCSIISGTDYTNIIEADGTTTVVPGYSNFNQQSITLSPDGDGAFVVSHNDNSRMGIGLYEDGDSSVADLVRGSYNNGTLWDSAVMNRSSASLAWDSDGCIWAPGFSGSGTLTCVGRDGSYEDLLTGLDHIESVALDSDEALYVSIGAEVLWVDKETGDTETVFEAAGDVLDMVFDYNDDLYVESDGVIELLPGDGAASSTFATVEDQGRLAIAPDGRLVRIMPAPTGAASWEEFDLE